MDKITQHLYRNPTSSDIYHPAVTGAKHFWVNHVEALVPKHPYMKVRLAIFLMFSISFNVKIDRVE